MTYFNDPAIPRFEYPEDFIETEHICDGCFCEIDELSAEECGYCEDCLCDADYDPETETETECDGCFYCLCVSDYDERKANGTLKS